MESDARDEILEKYRQNQALVLTSGNGWDKSTQVSQIILPELANGLKIACT